MHGTRKCAGNLFRHFCLNLKLKFIKCVDSRTDEAPCACNPSPEKAETGVALWCGSSSRSASLDYLVSSRPGRNPAFKKNRQGE